ncbi:barstar family protein [Chengkuizengella axinellae]|uniref:Barstar family protein n=1 Tax=Chengkuizengella axinellae TaxID=3064388 RepID=A0ABT9J298_9BACL|nr:barstar family protein [Chengkuizengella sp. 2205SS18-9]MDP5275739.1 barstar family protein [Chengkuizengella sp. 2205SS18-9]
MSDLIYLQKLSEPYFHIAFGTESDLCNMHWKSYFRINQQKIVSKMIRASKCKSVDTLFDEFSAAFQFPYYFGQNWGAFNECINDLEWMKGENYILFISNVNELLENESESEMISQQQLTNKPLSNPPTSL